jgi:hypothetical protein
MRTLETVSHPRFLITILQFNNKYILRFETGPYEQLYKFTPEMAAGIEAVKAYLTPEFLEEVGRHFDDMHQTLVKGFREKQGAG